MILLRRMVEKPQYKREFDFDFSLFDRKLAATGLVVLQWGWVESQLTLIAHGLADTDAAEWQHFRALRTTARRISLIQQLAHKKLRQPFREQLLDLLRDVEGARVLFDQVVNDHRGSPQDRKRPMEEKKTPFHEEWQENYEPGAWIWTFMTLMHVAERFHGLSGELSEFARQGAKDIEDDFLAEPIREDSAKVIRRMFRDDAQ